MQPAPFIRKILAWYDKHGRHDLPWQKTLTPYRVWVSEIMLQQTQVGTVIPYFHRFMKAFPTVESLAEAPLDDVLHQWTGLGYYARARNLHKAANIICKEYKKIFPNTVEALSKLPGIGHSTAGAIISISHDIPATVLDGNVKRVLSRFHAVPGWPMDPKVHATLWKIAESVLPQKRCRDYTQAMMDLGATLCTRSAPQCHACPLQQNCQAFLTQTVSRYPGKKPVKKLPIRALFLLVLENSQGAIFLEKRPDTGIWGGLWSLPEFTDLATLQVACYARFNMKLKEVKPLTPFRHTFSHYHLDITPIYAKPVRMQKKLLKKDAIWYNRDHIIGLAAPVKKILGEVFENA